MSCATPQFCEDVKYLGKIEYLDILNTSLDSRREGVSTWIIEKSATWAAIYYSRIRNIVMIILHFPVLSYCWPVRHRGLAAIITVY